jgi:hypothetical protein
MQSLALELFKTLLLASFFRIKAINSVSPSGPRAIIVSATIYLFCCPSLSNLKSKGMPSSAIYDPKLAIERHAAARTLQYGSCKAL